MLRFKNITFTNILGMQLFAFNIFKRLKPCKKKTQSILLIGFDEYFDSAEDIRHAFHGGGFEIG